MGAPCGSGGARAFARANDPHLYPPKPRLSRAPSLPPTPRLSHAGHCGRRRRRRRAAVARQWQRPRLLAESARNTHPVVDMRPLLQLAFKRNVLPQNLHGRRRRLCRQSLGRRLLSCRLRRASARSAHAARGCASHERGKASGMTEQRGSRKRHNTIRDKGTRKRRVILKLPAGNARGASLCSGRLHTFFRAFFQTFWKKIFNFVRAKCRALFPFLLQAPRFAPQRAPPSFSVVYISPTCVVF